MQSHLHMKHVNTQEVTHALISDFFSIWMWGKTIDFKAALKSELPGKRNSPSRACELHLQPQPRADVQCFEELNQTPFISALLLKVTQTGIRCRITLD